MPLSLLQKFLLSNMSFPSFVFHQLFVRLAQLSPEISLKDQNIPITGSNTGIGLGAARQCLKVDANNLIFAVRSIFKGKACRGVYILVTDRDALNAVDVGVTLALTLQRHFPNDFALEKVGRLLQHETTIAAIQAGNSLAEIKKLWADDLEDFKKRRERFMIYQSR